MKDKEMKHIRSGGRDVAFYAELGAYYFPDGRLNEEAFRTFIRQAFEEKFQKGPAGSESAELWLSEYMERVFAYLEEKGMGHTSFRLFSVAVEEGASLGIGKIALSPKRMQKLFAAMGGTESSPSAKNLDPEEKRERIFDSALAVFSQRGFHEATVEEIATCSGVAKGTVYRFFKSKDDLLDQLLTERSQKIVASLTSIFSTDHGVLDQIRDFVEQLVAFIEENPVLYRLIQIEGLSPRSEKRMTFDEYLISNFPMIKERFASMNESRQLKLASFHTVAYGMLGFIDGVTHKWFRSGMDYPLRDELPIMLEVLFNGFVGEGGIGKSFLESPKK